MSLSFDDAVTILRSQNEFTSASEKEKRDILLAGIENLIEFAAAQQWSMINEMPDELDKSRYDDYDEICHRYNLTWASQENEDVLYAASMAAWWVTLASETTLTFMTQGDERVRPWHESLEGLSYRKNEFPPDLIPPIEYGCRCFLVADGYGSVMGSIPKDRALVSVHPVFRESLCTGGRIFSSEHPYFRKVIPPHVKGIIKTLKKKFNL